MAKQQFVIAQKQGGFIAAAAAQNYTCKVKTTKQWIYHDDYQDFSAIFTRDCRHVVHQLCGFRLYTKSRWGNAAIPCKILLL